MGSGAAFGVQAAPEGRGLVVGAAAADRVSHRSHDGQHHADEQDDDADAPQDRDFQQESGGQKDESQDDHGVLLNFDVVEG